MNADELRAMMKEAFHGVTLDGGVSLRQGEICDNYGKNIDGRPVSKAEFASIPSKEITNDWRKLPLAELERYPYLAYLDAKGFRYYIPAFLVSLLADATGASMRVISTLACLRPKRDRWRYHIGLYELLSDEQRSAIAVFLHQLQAWSSLDAEDVRLISRALRDYWQQFLPPHAQASPIDHASR